MCVYVFVPMISVFCGMGMHTCMQCVFWRKKATIPVDSPQRYWLQKGGDKPSPVMWLEAQSPWGSAHLLITWTPAEPPLSIFWPHHRVGVGFQENIYQVYITWYLVTTQEVIPLTLLTTYDVSTPNKSNCVWFFFFQKGSDDPLLSLPMSYLDTLQKNGRACLMQKALVSCSQTVDCHGWKGTGRYFNARFKLLLPLSCLPSAWACWVRLGCSSAVKPLWDDSVRFAAGHAHLLYDLHAFSEGNAAAESCMLYSRVQGHWKAADGLSWAIKELCLRIHTQNSNCKWLTFGWALQGLQSTSVLYFHLILS